MKKKLLLFLLLASSIAMQAAAVAYNVWDGTTAAVTKTGHRYTVTTVAQLAYLAQQNDTENGYAGDTILVAANLDLNGRPWTPLGTKAKPFMGVLDGQNHLVRGLSRFTGTDGVGVMGHVGTAGKVMRLGVSGGQVLANTQRRVGTIAGVNKGEITKCWNMSEIAVAGTCVGGLVGENNGTMRDVYNAGMILRGADTIGGLVGINTGTIEYAYSTGYIHNGYALVGYDRLGSHYTQCYHDRKLYYQAAGSLESGIYSVDRSGAMCSLFLTRAEWHHQTNLYPALAGFETTDASMVSVSPLWLDTTATTPPDHANDLSLNFKVSNLNGVAWSCREEAGTAWIQIAGENATVKQTCDGADVLLNVDLGTEQRIVYTHPRRLNDFYPGSFTKQAGARDQWCNPSNFPLNQYTTLSPATDGWKYGSYHYQVVLDTIDPGTLDTTRLQVLLADADWATVQAWFSTYTYPATVAGFYMIRIYSHDEMCSPDWTEMSGSGYSFEVFEEFDSGTIVNGEDTIYGSSATVNASSLTDASGGGGTIAYTWYVTIGGQQQEIPGQNDKNLNGYVITTPGTYVFSRGAYDEYCETVPSATLNHGTHVVVLRSEVDPGSVINNPSTRTYCTLADAQKDTIYGTLPTGGTGYYEYQWYMDGTPISGATKKDLALKDVAGLTAGSTHVFTHAVKDNTDYTTLTPSKNSVTVIISSGFDAGKIENRTLPDKCIMGSSVQNITLYIASVVDASGDGTLTYTWYRAEADGSNPVVVGHSAELNLTFPSSDIEVGKTYIYYREVTNVTCGSNPVRSTGTVTQTYTANDHKDTTIFLCTAELPKAIFYPDPNDGPYVHKFTAEEEGIPYTFRDMTGGTDCYPTMTVTMHTKESPEIRVDSVAKLCQDEGTITIYYEVLEGSPDSFYIELSPSLARYFDNQKIITGTMEPKNAGEIGMIQLKNVKRIGMGTNELWVQVGYRATSGHYICFSMMHPMSLEVNIGGYIYQRFDKVLFVDNQPDNEDRLTFTAYQWYKDGVLQPGQTGQYYQENGRTLRGVYYADLTAIEYGIQTTYRSCEVIMPQEGSAAVAAQEEEDEAYLTIHNDQVVIVRDNQMYDMLGREVK